ncbi:hypothetical protein KIW_04935 [Pediococcus acidilactici MA18/5M]|nr:hypothetical protein KIW_04935 [Pediococcus acidilactici MA18/5M]
MPVPDANIAILIINQLLKVRRLVHFLGASSLGQS